MTSPVRLSSTALALLVTGQPGSGHDYVHDTIRRATSFSPDYFEARLEAAAAVLNRNKKKPLFIQDYPRDQAFRAKVLEDLISAVNLDIRNSLAALKRDAASTGMHTGTAYGMNSAVVRKVYSAMFTEGEAVDAFLDATTIDGVCHGRVLAVACPIQEVCRPRVQVEFEAARGEGIDFWLTPEVAARYHAQALKNLGPLGAPRVNPKFAARFPGESRKAIERSNPLIRKEDRRKGFRILLTLRKPDTSEMTVRPRSIYHELRKMSGISILGRQPPSAARR